MAILIISPVFGGLFDFCAMYTGASLQGATKLNHQVYWVILHLIFLIADDNIRFCDIIRVKRVYLLNFVDIQ